MIKRDFKFVVFVFTVLFVMAFFFYQFIPEVNSQTNHIVISEIQIAGDESTTDEFVELYNPLPEDVDLSGWRLRRATSSGSDSNLVASLSGTIKAHGFYLIAHENYTGTVTPDENYSTAGSVADDNSVILYSDAGVTVVDMVGMGEAHTDFLENTATVNPDVNQSIERKANSESTSTSMASGGEDENSGNGHDTDNNLNDFVLGTSPDPQNSDSPVEGPVEPTPTPTTTPTVTPSVTPSVTPTPTSNPSPTPTSDPTPTPTSNPSPTPTPTDEPTPTLEPTPTPTQDPEVPESRVLGVFSFSGQTTVCQVNYKLVSISFFKFVVPQVSCQST